MRIAILLADEVNPDLIAEHGDLQYIFSQFFESISGLQYSYYDVRTHSLPAIDKYDAYIISGSRHDINEKLNWLDQLKQLVKHIIAEKRKLLGICFGHQLIADILGGTVEPFREAGNYGLRHVNISVKQPWMVPDSNKLQLLFNHRYYVATLPPHVTLLATTEHYVQMFSYKNHVLGIQCHPEYSVSYQRKIMEASGADLTNHYSIPTQNDLSDLSQSVQTMRAWLGNFLIG